MGKAEPTSGIERSSFSKGKLPDNSVAESGDIRKSWMNDGLWDAYRLEALLPLKEMYRENTEFGFLLRHYWIPATALTFRQASRTTFSDGRAEHADWVIERRMARCRSNECLWREKTHSVVEANGNSEHSAAREMLCSYDCYEQTFHSAQPILFASPTAEQKTEARRQALYRLPMLCPPGPVPIGFSWHGKVGDDYMNYCLEAEERIGGGETSVLVVRREGRYTTWIGDCPDFCEAKMGLSPSASGNGQKATPVVTERKGVTLFAWNRGVVLEDRFLDRVMEADGHPVVVAGMTNQVVTRLVRSCPTEDTQR